MIGNELHLHLDAHVALWSLIKAEDVPMTERLYIGTCAGMSSMRICSAVNSVGWNLFCVDCCKHGCSCQMAANGGISSRRCCFG